MKRAQIAVVLTYDAETTTLEDATKNAQGIVRDIMFGPYEYYPYAGEPWVDEEYDSDSWNKEV